MSSPICLLYEFLIILMETIKPIYRSSNDDNHSFDEKYSQTRTIQMMVIQESDI